MRPTDRDQALIALGSNLGDRPGILAKALDKIGQHGSLLAVSNCFETEPEGGVANQRFLNGACVLATALDPPSLLSKLLEIEQLFGRARQKRWENRTLDLDIILWQDRGGAPLAIDSLELQIPHPRCQERLFVLLPAAQVAADWRIPPAGFSIAACLAKLRSQVAFQ